MTTITNNFPPMNPNATTGVTNIQDRAQKGNKPASQAAPMDTVTLQQNTQKPEPSYTSGLTPEKMTDKGYEMLRRLVTSMLKEQGIDYTIATGDSAINLSEISQEEAQELVADDGYFGVEQTSDRIVDFAIAAAGGDIGNLDAIKEGVEKGFNEALEAFGGTLPDISYDTLDAVMEKLDAWAAQTDGK